ncbi:hypothetical protein F5I97DRAFT_480279 [Phlebopus sp. FC_14]|nr:hypothetical protein F5I97DRAFT_480279 [Phlebopus sp. FC_14]
MLCRYNWDNKYVTAQKSLLGQKPDPLIWDIILLFAWTRISVGSFSVRYIQKAYYAMDHSDRISTDRLCLQKSRSNSSTADFITWMRFLNSTLARGVAATLPSSFSLFHFQGVRDGFVRRIETCSWCALTTSKIPLQPHVVNLSILNPARHYNGWTYIITTQVLFDDIIPTKYRDTTPFKYSCRICL